MPYLSARRRVPVLAVLVLAALGGLAALSGDEVPNLVAQPGVTITGPRNASGSAGRPLAVNDGEVQDYGPSHGYAWASLDTPLVATFPEARPVNKVELLLLDVDARSYDFRVEVSVDGKEFRPVGERKAARACQTLTFPEAPCRAIRVVFTGTTVESRSYHVVELAAYHQADPPQPSPLRQAFDKRGAYHARQAAILSERLDVQPLMAAVFTDPEVMQRLRAAPEKGVVGLAASTPVAGPPQQIAAWREGTTVVAVLDEDGDMRPGAPQADTDSDCWAVDYRGDGSIDRVVDYQDDDRDGDADAMVLYLMPPNLWSRTQMTCAAIRDVGDDNRMWWLHNYSYDQNLCQWKCDFGGDEVFVLGYFDDRAGKWVSAYENPFCFYDVDGDGASEIAVRYVGADLRLRSLRYSFDADNDTGPGNPRDYDVSLTVLGSVQAPEDVGDEFPMRGGGKLPHVAWKHARRLGQTAAWQRALLCWDETDNNVNSASAAERDHERWEGVLNPGSAHFPQEGGPPISALNTRQEVDSDFSGKLGLYYSEVDHRIHLRGAELGWIDVDYDHDRKVDMRLRFEDSDGNGFFDTWKTDSDGDGTFERSIHVKDERARPVPLEYEAIRKAQTAGLAAARAADQKLGPILLKAAGGWQSPVERYWLADLATAHYAGKKVRASAEGQRYYADLIRESYFAQARGRARGAPERLDAAFAAGDAALLQRLLGPVSARAEPAARAAVTLRNPLPVARTQEAVVLSLADFPELRAALRNGASAAVRFDRRKVVPAQADDLDGDGTADELVFLADLPPQGRRRVTVAVPAPAGVVAPRQTAANPDMGASIGWESELVAYRTYYGKLDYFAKKRRILKLHELQGAYHSDSDWGMDALHIGTSAGVGGLYLLEGDKALPLMNEEGAHDIVSIARRVVVAGPLRTVVEVTLTGPKGAKQPVTVTRRFAICANDLHTTDTLTVSGGTGSVFVAAGLIKMAGAQPEQRLMPPIGSLSIWGKQGHPDVVGAGEIGMALLFPTAGLAKLSGNAVDHLAILRVKPGEPQKLYFAADWAKGGRSKTAADWHAATEALGQRLGAPIKVGR